MLCPEKVIFFISSLSCTAHELKKTILLFSGKGMLAVAVPNESKGQGRWTTSDHLTALHTLAAITITKALLFIGSMCPYY